MTTIVDRKIVQKYMELYQANALNVMFLSLGSGTAANEILDYLGLESTEQNIFFYSSSCFFKYLPTTLEKFRMSLI